MTLFDAIARSTARDVMERTGAPRRREPIPSFDAATLDTLRQIGELTIETHDDGWTSYVLSPVVEVAQRQLSVIKQWREHHRRTSPDVLGAIIERVRDRAAAIERSRARFLAALPRDPALIGKRMPLHFDGNGDIFLLLESNVWHLTQAGEWREGPKTPPPEPSQETQALMRIEADLQGVKSHLDAVAAFHEKTVTAIQTLDKRTRRRWWQFWRDS